MRQYCIHHIVLVRLLEILQVISDDYISKGNKALDLVIPNDGLAKNA